MKKKQRYTLSVYMLLTTIAIILILFSLNYLNEYQDTKSILLNLSTEIAGAVLLFLIVNNLFSLGNNDNSKLDTLINQVNNKFSPLNSNKKFTSNYIFSKINPDDVERINILSYSLSPSIRRNRQKISNAVKNGAKVRILIIGQEGEAINLIKSNSSAKDESIKADFYSSFGHLKDIFNNKKNKGSIEVRFIQWIPSCSMYIIENKSVVDDQARIGIYHPAIKSKNIRKFGLHLLRSTHANEFGYFLEQYNLLWNDSESLDLKDTV